MSGTRPDTFRVVGQVFVRMFNILFPIAADIFLWSGIATGGPYEVGQLSNLEHCSELNQVIDGTMVPSHG
jgi:hypothetical protein